MLHLTFRTLLTCALSRGYIPPTMTLLSSPPSVTKPPGLKMKDAEDSSARRALFQHSPSDAEDADPLDVVDGENDDTSHDPAEVPPAPTTATKEVTSKVPLASTVEKRHRQVSAKASATADAKKAKN